ncbi:molybdenum cofactor biosynthesis protein MoaE [Balneola sp. MJW-20]|uniref:molybdenum cofactor biosynthesis protein MoaE n=1 Tax=Gracilimonas aurantiaca TaxID=3234185 RepID=UPI003464EAA5
MTKKAPKKVFTDGPLSPDMVSDSIAAHQAKTNIGAHSIFLGQVRADKVDGKIVKAIEYSAYEEMALNAFHEIREKAFSRFEEMTCCHIYHSLGTVKTGEICLFVFTSSKHRRVAIESCDFIVEEIKSQVPIFGKELFEDESHQWKVNT